LFRCRTTEAAELLLEHGANPRIKDNDGKCRSSLFLAASPDHDSSEECVRVFLDEGADVDLGDRYEWTVLMSGCDKAWPVAIVRLLLEAGANVNFQNCDGWNALIFASGQGYLEHVRLLLDFGADPNLTSNNGPINGWTSLILTTDCNN
jgi:serine/threonine-protein phosphatase 6 regulatory ankyrin repeat subunit B